MNTTFTAPGISCGKCAARVKGALAGLPGVKSVEVEVPTKRVTVAYDEAATSPEQLAGALEEAGYPGDRSD